MSLLIQNRKYSNVWNNKAHSSIAKTSFALITSKVDSDFYFSPFGPAQKNLVCATSTGAKTMKSSGLAAPESSATIFSFLYNYKRFSFVIRIWSGISLCDFKINSIWQIRKTRMSVISLNLQRNNRMLLSWCECTSIVKSF